VDIPVDARVVALPATSTLAAPASTSASRTAGRRSAYNASTPHMQAIRAPLTWNAAATSSAVLVAPAFGVSIPPAWNRLAAKTPARCARRPGRAWPGRPWAGFLGVRLLAELLERLRQPDLRQPARRLLGRGLADDRFLGQVGGISLTQSIFRVADRSRRYDFCLDHDYNYSYLSFFRLSGGEVAHGYLLGARCRARARTPRRIAPHFAQVIAVADTDADAERLYKEHVLYFYNRCLHVAPAFNDPPGYRTVDTIMAASPARLLRQAQRPTQEVTWQQLVDGGMVIAGSPLTVRSAWRSSSSPCASVTSSACSTRESTG